MLTAEFGIDLDDDSELREADLARRLADCADELRDDAHLYGHLHLAGDDVELDLEDELVPMVARLCFGALPDLLAHRPIELRYWAYNGTLRLDPAGDRVRISGDGIDAPAELDAAALAIALHDCGDRVVALLVQVGHDATRVAALTAAGAQATAALVAAGLR